MNNQIEEEHNEVTGEECPYCGSIDKCEHLVVLLNTTDRSAIGGPLMDIFNQRWFSLLEKNESCASFDEREAFDELLSDLEGVSDASIEYEIDECPGQSCSYQGYFVGTENRVREVLGSFEGVKSRHG